MSEHPRDTDTLKWLKAENMLLAICMKAMLSKLDPEVGAEVAAALTAARDVPEGTPGRDTLVQVAATLMARLR